MHRLPRSTEKREKKLENDKINELWDKYDVDSEYNKAYKTYAKVTTDERGRLKTEREEWIDEDQLMKAEQLEYDIWKEAEDYASQILKEKYGDYTFDELEAQSAKVDRGQDIALAITLGALGAVTIWSMVKG